MASIEFRSDVSMQDIDVPELVLFLLVPKPSPVTVRLPLSAPFLEQIPYASEHVAGSQVSTTAFKITCGQDVPLDEPVPVLSIGSDASRCDLVLDRRHTDSVHCRIYAQLNSGFDVWVIKDDSTTGTFHGRLKDEKDRENIDDTEEIHTEELVHKDCKAVEGLRYLRIGPYEFHCRPSEDQKEIAERNRWFRRHEPLPITSQLLTTQLAGRRLDIQERKNIGKGGFGEVFKSMEMHTGLLVAVKKQKVGNDPRGVKNIHQEIRSMKDLYHVSFLKPILKRI